MKRHKDAIAIQGGACNPSAIALSIAAACAEMRAEKDHKGTGQICADPAIRLMVHQLAFLVRVAELDATHAAYMGAVEACEIAQGLHWDPANPWRAHLVYIPLERAAQCVAGGNIDNCGTIEPFSVAFILKHWREQHGEQLDAYILPQPDGAHSIGVRFGAEGNEYLSPHNANPEITNELLCRYGKDAV